MFKCSIEAESCVLEWCVEHAGLLLSRYKMGKDGKTVFRRVMGKECKAVALEFGEQVLAKPKRNTRSLRKQSLKSRWLDATWVTSSRNSNEHVVILEDGGPAIKVRTVERKPIDARWSKEAIINIKARPRNPNPKDPRQFDAAAESSTTGLGIKEDGSKLLAPKTEDVEMKMRDFKITKELLSKFGYTDDCPGCHAAVFGYRRNHTSICRARLEEKMSKDPCLDSRLKSRDRRLGREVVDKSAVEPQESEAKKDIEEPVVLQEDGEDDDTDRDEEEVEKTAR